MGNIGLPELLIVLVIALVVFGPKRLPQMGRQLGQAIREFRTATTEIRSQIGIDDIAGSVNDLKSGLSLTGDPQPVQPATSAPDSVAPAAVTAAVTEPVATSALAPAEPAVDDGASPAPAAAADVPAAAGPDGDVPAVDAPAADAPIDEVPAVDVLVDEGAGVETFGKLTRSTTPAPAPTAAD